MSRLRVYLANGSMPIDFTELDGETVVSQTLRWFQTSRDGDILNFSDDNGETYVQRWHISSMVVTP